MIGIVFVMGVSGSGKTTLGRALAEETGAVFLEGDAFHPPENVAAMSAGMPLTDAMRQPWLVALGKAAAAERAAGCDVVVACSALRHSYRDLLRTLAGPCRFLHLDAGPEVMGPRVAARTDHYMPASLVASQYAALEAPGPDEPDALRLDASLSPEALLATARRALDSQPARA